jgi:hypothetical protein
MPETLKTILFLLAAIGAILLSLRFVVWRMRKAGEFIILDLKKQGAFDPSTAVVLPYSETRLLRIGLRDYRPRVLQELIRQDVVRVAEGGRCYLREGRGAAEEGNRPAR